MAGHRAGGEAAGRVLSCPDSLLSFPIAHQLTGTFAECQGSDVPDSSLLLKRQGQGTLPFLGVTLKCRGSAGGGHGEHLLWARLSGWDACLRAGPGASGSTYLAAQVDGHLAQE